MPSSVGTWMYHKTVTTTPTIPTIVKIANWIRTKRVSIYGPPSVGWLVVGVAPGSGTPGFAGSGGAPDCGAAAAPGPSHDRPATIGGTGGAGAPDGGASADCGLSGAGVADGGGPGGGPQGGGKWVNAGSPTGPGATTPPGAPGGAPYLNCRYSGSPGAGTDSAPSRPQWVPSRMLLRSPAFVKSITKYPLT